MAQHKISEKPIDPHMFLRRCFDCNRNVRDGEGSSYQHRLWRCAACTAKRRSNA